MEIPQITNKRIVPGWGNKQSKIVVVGEAPGRSEEEQLKPFVGTSGRLLQSLFFRSGLIWKDMYVTNVVKERPNNNNIDPFIKYRRGTVTTSDSFDRYRDLLIEEISAIKPNVVLAVGNISLYALCGEWGITSWRGSIMESTVIPGLKVIPTLHPASALRNYIYQYFIFADLKRLKKESEFKWINKIDADIRTAVGTGEALTYLDACHNSELVGFDTEVGGFRQGLSEISCISISNSPTSAINITFSQGGQVKWSPENEKLIWDSYNELLKNPKIRKVAQNRFFDQHFSFRRYGIVAHNVEDTMIAQALLFPDFPKSLDFIVSMMTDIGYYQSGDKNFLGYGGNEEKFYMYSAKDSLALTITWPQFERQLRDKGLWETYKAQNGIVDSLIFMSEHGIKIDTEGLKRKSIETSKRLDELEKEFKDSVGHDINMRSTQQLQEYFYGKKKDGGLGIKPYKNRKSGNPTTDEKALQKLAKPLESRPAVEEAQILLEHRKLSKLKSTYYEMDIDLDGRIRSSMNPVGAKTGRLSSSKNIFGTGANLQNQPHDLKRYQLVDNGYIGYEVDKSQAENRIVAYVAPEIRLIEAFENGIDIHSRTASYIFMKPEGEINKEDGSAPQFGNGEHSERFWGKKANHAFNYGQSANAFADQMLIVKGQADRIYHAYHNAYPGVRKYWREIENELSKTRTLTNLFGRRYTFLDRMDYNLFKQAYAFIPQSTVADIINRWGLIPIYKSMPHVVLLNQIHDSIVFEIPVKAGFKAHIEMLTEICERLNQPLEWGGRKFVIPSDVKIFTHNFMEGIECHDKDISNTIQENWSKLMYESMTRPKIA